MHAARNAEMGPTVLGMTLRRALLVIATATLLAASIEGAGATVRATSTQTFAPVADADVNQQKRSANSGAANKLRVDASPVLRSYLRFEVSGVSGSVTGATLRLFPKGSLAAGFGVRRVTSTIWGEKRVTYANAPAYDATVLATSGSVTQGQWVSLNVTAAVTGNGAYSFALTGSSATALALASREAGAAKAPQLVVDGSSNDPVVMAAGDIACDPDNGSFNGGNGTSSACRQKVVSDLIVDATPSAVVTLGDNQYENGAYDKYLASFDPSWGRFKGLIRPVPGNHEYNTPNGAGYYEYFGTAAANPAKGWYSYDVGAWHLIALNSNCASVGGCGVGSAQEQWLRSDLASHANVCVLAYWHHPRFSSGDHGSDTAYDAFWQALYQAGADLILVGHDHDYERFAPLAPSGTVDAAKGIRQFVVGTGGKTHNEFGTLKTGSEARDSSTFGVLKLTLHAGSYDWQFLPEPGRSFTDSGSGACHTAP
jgi:hypothetical protein